MLPQMIDGPVIRGLPATSSEGLMHLKLKLNESWKESIEWEMNYLITQPKTLHSVLKCKKGIGLIRNRDFNARLNLKYISEAIWETGQRTSEILRPQKASKMQ